jgi:hypothetical protein
MKNELMEAFRYEDSGSLNEKHETVDGCPSDTLHTVSELSSISNEEL